MRGYWKDDARTRESIDAAGWMHSGDLATIDAEGYANIVGRVKDMLIRGGENVYPREIEEYLLRHPASRTRRCSAFPTRSTARRSAPGSSRGAATRSTRRGARLLQRPDRPLQGAALRAHRRAVPADGDRKAQKFEMRKAMIAELGSETSEPRDCHRDRQGSASTAAPLGR
jgi:fatty-acyl-CoA synthase